MVTQGSSTKRQKPVISTGQVPEWDQVAALKSVDFDTLVVERMAVKTAEDAAIKRRKELDAQIESLLLLTATEKVLYRGALVERIISHVAGKQDPQATATALVEMGVDADLVAAGMEIGWVAGKEYSYVKVTVSDAGN